MERNAYTLVKLIQELNAQMQAANPGTTEKIVVVGPSMGGQIARYALTYMEANIIPHNTRLFISLDSPNNGATIPIGLQHFVKFFSGQTESQDLKDGLGLLDSPASRQLTLQHHSQAPFSFPSSPTPYQADPLRTNFVNSLNGLGGYPAQLRRVAVTNGALDAAPQRDQNGQVINAGDQAFLLEQRGVPEGGVAGTVVRALIPIGLIGRLVTTAKARVYYGPGYGQTARVLEAYTIVEGTKNRSAVGVPSSCSLDGTSGGYRNYLGFAKSDKTGGLLTHVFQKRNYYSVRDQSCFIPTLSGLGYTQLADNCQPVGQTLVCAGLTPFDAYYGPTGRNQEHLQLTPANVEFMRNEILRITPKPVFSAAPATICPGGTATYSVLAECARAGQPATTYTWTPGAGLQFTNGSTGTGPSQDVEAVAGFLGYATVTVQATRQGYLPAPAVQQLVHVTPATLALRPPAAPVCMQQSNFAVTVQSANIGGPFVWSVTPLHCGIAEESGTGATLVPTRAGNVVVTMTGTNLCTGQRQAHSVTVPVTNCLSEGQRLAAYPNPADDVLHLAAPEASAAPGPRTAVLYNTHGREVGRTAAPQAAQLPTAGLPEGLYYLLVEQGGHVTRSQIRVQH